MSATNTLDIKLQGKDYRVACAPEEREALLAAASFLDAKMNEIAEITRSSGERLAVMAALNISHELLALRQSPDKAAAVDAEVARRRIKAIEARLDTVLAEQKQDALF
ncbi:Cell division protein ZapA [Georgfuchsia toluolica]|uniref:Cell division protein ZapA n=1 Tax=Georgfuchsia toluolica TaxID=424218 RepID=A0A916J5Z1_9PROT|nr:cell division protein ZapA [Georgfuchsia toluolica]CAG4884068.1 Cell division protein ZapA [Georgfuchsia toluolica]